MPNRLTAFLLSAAWLTVTPGVALAQAVTAPADKAAPATTVSRLTVQAPPSPRLPRERTQRFVRSYAAAPNPNIDQIGRWREPVCVMVLGLPLADQAARIKARIETMAQSLGLPAAREGCAPNVEIAFEDDPQRAMDGVARRLEYLLGYYHLSRTIQLKTITHPIQAWYVTATRSEGVETAGLVSSGLPQAFFQKPEAIDDPENPAPAGCLSRFTSCYTSRFHNVLIVADNKALVGLSLRLVGDDLVMLALSQPRSLDGCNALPSVIDRFAKSPCPGRDPPDGLTPADTAYLTALYSADLEARKGTEQFDLAGRMARSLIQAKAAAAASPAAANTP
jgi:hypothetical protein